MTTCAHCGQVWLCGTCCYVERERVRALLNAFNEAVAPMPTHTCGCTIEYGATDDARDRIAYCPLHAAAGEMRAALESLIEADDMDPRTWPMITAASIVYSLAFDTARAVLARIGG